MNLDSSQVFFIFLNGMFIAFGAFLKNPLSLAMIVGIVVLRWYLESNKFKGIFGEKVTDFFLSKLDSKKYKVVNDIILKNGDFYSQIDHVVISEYGIFVIETKVRTGSVYGSVSSQTWTQYIHGNKFPFQNPIHQNYGHIQMLLKVLNTESLPQPISIIAFSGDTITKVSGDYANTFVTRLSQVVPLIKTFQTEQLSSDLTAKIYKALVTLQKEGTRYKKEQLQYANLRRDH